MSLPDDYQARKAIPIATGVLDYFPDAIAAVAECSRAGNDQHNPGQPLHWDRSKSTDEADALIRHFLERGTIDSDGIRHSAKAAWRALALLQKEIEVSRPPEAVQRRDTVPGMAVWSEPDEQEAPAAPGRLGAPNPGAGRYAHGPGEIRNG